MKSSIHLISGFHFGGVKVLRDGLRVEFLASSSIDDPRIAHRLVLGPRRVAHTVLIRSGADLTPDLRRWLRDAQRLQA